MPIRLRLLCTCLTIRRLTTCNDPFDAKLLADQASENHQIIGQIALIELVAKQSSQMGLEYLPQNEYHPGENCVQQV
jgi:hypothetical protein